MKITLLQPQDWLTCCAYNKLLCVPLSSSLHHYNLFFLFFLLLYSHWCDLQGWLGLKNQSLTCSSCSPSSNNEQSSPCLLWGQWLCRCHGSKGRGYSVHLHVPQSRWGKHRASPWKGNGSFLMKQVTAGNEIESEVGLCSNRSGGSRDRKRGCLFRSRLRSLLSTVVLIPAFNYSPYSIFQL